MRSRNDKINEAHETSIETILEIESRSYLEYRKHIEEHREEYFKTRLTKSEFTVEDVRKMSIFSASKWKDWYVLYASDSGDKIDEDGFFPESTHTIFVNSKTGEVLDRKFSGWMIREFAEIDHRIETKAIKPVPFDNLKIG